MMCNDGNRSIEETLNNGAGLVGVDPDTPIHAATPAGIAVRRVLYRLLGDLTDKADGVLAGQGPEYLHDLRIAVRKSRTLLGQLRGALPRHVVQRCRWEFAWLAMETGPARDADVHLGYLVDYRRKLPAALQGALPFIEQLLQHRRARAYGDVGRALCSDRYQVFVTDYAQYLRGGIAAPGPGPLLVDAPWAREPVGQLLDRRIWRLRRRVIAKGRQLGEASPATAWHQLRKDCKKLRYLIETFRCLYPHKASGRLIASLKALQEDLGAVNDLQVQAEALIAMGRERHGQTAVDVSAQAVVGEAVVWLVTHLRRRQRKQRRRFLKSFADFQSPHQRRLAKRLFRSRRPIALGHAGAETP